MPVGDVMWFIQLLGLILVIVFCFWLPHVRLQKELTAYGNLLCLLLQRESPQRRKAAEKMLAEVKECQEVFRAYIHCSSTGAVWPLEYCAKQLSGSRLTPQGQIEFLANLAPDKSRVVSPHQLGFLRDLARAIGIDSLAADRAVRDVVFANIGSALIYLILRAMAASGGVTESGVDALHRKLASLDVPQDSASALLVTLQELPNFESEAAQAVLSALYAVGGKAEATEAFGMEFMGVFASPNTVADRVKLYEWIANSPAMLALGQELHGKLALTARVLGDLSTLGFSDTAIFNDPTWHDIEVAYRTLVKGLHPDRLINRDIHAEIVDYAEGRLKEANAAFARLRAFNQTMNK